MILVLARTLTKRLFDRFELGHNSAWGTSCELLGTGPFETLCWLQAVNSCELMAIDSFKLSVPPVGLVGATVAPKLQTTIQYLRHIVFVPTG